MAADKIMLKIYIFPVSSLYQLIMHHHNDFLPCRFIFLPRINTVCVHGLPIHDHGIQRGLPGLIWAPAIADAAITLLHFTTSTAHLHCIQHWAAGLQGAPRCRTKQNTVRHQVCTIHCETQPGEEVNPLRQTMMVFISSWQCQTRFD